MIWKADKTDTSLRQDFTRGHWEKCQGLPPPCRHPNRPPAPSPRRRRHPPARPGAASGGRALPRDVSRFAAADGSGRAASTAIYFLLARRRGVALAPGRRRRGLALVRGRAAGADDRRGRGAGARSGWAPTLPPASARRRWCRPAPGSRRESLGAWTLVGCTVAPGFQFAGFELAPPGFEPA